jgi:proteasome lid subunit RPN8/RPN11
MKSPTLPTWPAIRFQLPAIHHHALQEHAEAEQPLECCGFLAGQVEQQIVTVTRIYPITNERASATAFRTAPRDVLAAFRAMRQRHEELVAIYHSHPTSAPIPSQRDLHENTYGRIPWLILGRTHSPNWEFQAWTLHETDYEPILLIVSDMPEK